MEYKTWKIIKLLLTALLLLGLIMFIGQVMGMYRQVNAQHHLLGKGFLLLLAGIIGYGILYPLYAFMTLPRPLPLPEEKDAEGRRLYRKDLILQLNDNPALRKAGFSLLPQDAPEEVLLEQLAFLNKGAETKSRDTASQVFVTTAIIQNGSLDGLFVFISLTRLIWHIAHLYRQRPGLRQLAALYFNVGATVLLAREIDDLELMDEQLEPLMTTIFGSLFSSLVPGATAAVNLIINSTAQGIANAYLTLRVGLIAQQYMGSLAAPERRLVRKLASLQACRLLGLVVKDNAVRIRQATVNLTKKNAEDAFTYSKEKVESVFSKPKEMWERWRGQGEDHHQAGKT
ncbi:DUF697 domain-containing protein [Anoxynatronum sibiricum]|uniref:DUF697 domain-containing protein n=1 Tax=Anoxynatronum sibiricum TaxID=210623 RepID=A0ABU9VSV4_9CLOT